MLVKTITESGYSIYFYKMGLDKLIVVDDPVDGFYARYKFNGNSCFFADTPIKYLTPSNTTAITKFLAGNNDFGNGPSRYVRQIPGLKALVKHPMNEHLNSIEWTIINLNDVHGWTREQIADWLETLDENPILNNPKETINV